MIMKNINQIVIYEPEDRKIKFGTRLLKETVWINLKQLPDLFQRDKSAISRHINNIFKEGELLRNSVVAKYATTAGGWKK